MTTNTTEQGNMEKRNNNIFLLPNQKFYGIHRGYNWRRYPEEYYAPEHPNYYQIPVYASARQILQERNYKSVIDVGCGSGHKLVQFFSDVHTIGIETPRTIKFLRQKYPLRVWNSTPLWTSSNITADLCICIDVIEHLTDPDLLLCFLQQLDVKRFLISTPERDLMGENTHNGPPRNKCHVREWNQLEFSKYLCEWFKIERHYIVDTATQVVEMVKL